MIPPGTNDRIERGESVNDVLPGELLAYVGDVIVLQNDDEVFHIYGPVSARSGETVEWTLGYAGVFSGLCTVSSDRQVTVTVVER